MNRGPTLSRLMQVTEEALPPVHTPVFHGNECFIVTQQDVRRVTDTRVFSYSKLMDNGELIPMEKLGHDVCISEAIISANTARAQNDQQQDYTAVVNLLTEIISRICNCATKQTAMDVDTPSAATLEQQLQWEKAAQSNNTTEPVNAEKKPCCCHCNHSEQHHSDQNIGNSTKEHEKHSCGVNTINFSEQQSQADRLALNELSALAQMKLKKLCKSVNFTHTP